MPIAAHLGLDRAEVRSRNFIQPERDALRPRADVPGRPAAEVRLGRLPGIPGQAQGARRLGRLRRLPRAGRRPRGAGWAWASAATSRAPASAPTRAATSTSRRAAGSTSRPGLTTQGQGHQTILAQIVADELGVRIEDVHVTTGDTRRMPYAVGTFASRGAVMSGNAVALAARVVRAKALRIAADALEVSPDDLEIDDGVISVKGAPGTSIALSTVAVLSNPLRYAFDESAAGRNAVRRHLRPRQAAGGRRRGAGPRGQGLLLPHPGDLRQRHARGDRRDRPGHGRDPHPALLRRPRLRRHGQPDDRRGPGARRRRAGRRRGALRADGLRRVRAAAQRLVHGLPHALRLRGAAHRDRPPRDAQPAQPARPQGRRRGRHASRCPPSSPRPSRTPRASPSARCRSARPSCGSCASSTPTATDPVPAQEGSR